MNEASPNYSSPVAVLRIRMLAVLVILLLANLPARAVAEAENPESKTYTVVFEPLSNNETGSRVSIRLPPAISAPREKPYVSLDSASVSSSVENGKPYLRISHERFDDSLEAELSPWLRIQGKWEVRWTNREIQGNSRCLESTGRFPPMDNYPAEISYLIGCEPGSGGSNGFVLVIISVVEPAWNESFDKEVVDMAKSIRMEPVRALPAASEIIGKVTALRDDAVKIEFTASPGAGPMLGDTVAFQVQRAGMEIAAGRGRIIGIASGVAWAKAAEGKPAIGMAAVISARGRAMKPGEYQGMYISEGSLQMENVEGYLEMLLPPGFHPHIHHPDSPRWDMDSAVGGGHALNPILPNVPSPNWGITVRPIVSFSGPLSLEQLHDGGYQDYMSGSISDPNNYKERWKRRSMHGATTCLAWSFLDDSDRDGQDLDSKKWQVFCEDARGRDFELVFRLYGINWTDDDDTLVERMVRSFKPLR